MRVLGEKREHLFFFQVCSLAGHQSYFFSWSKKFIVCGCKLSKKVYLLAKIYSCFRMEFKEHC